jgi:hypothetical protein
MRRARTAHRRAAELERAAGNAWQLGVSPSVGNVIHQVQGLALSMQQSREAVIRAGEAHCQRFNDPVVCHEKK